LIGWILGIALIKQGRGPKND